MISGFKYGWSFWVSNWCPFLKIPGGLQAHQVDPFREERPMLSEAAIQRLPGKFFREIQGMW